MFTFDRMEVALMKDKDSTMKKQPFYKKVIGIGIMVVIAIYCIPELQEKVILGIDFIKSEWRKMK